MRKLGRSLIDALVVLLAVSSASFLLVRMLPGDPVIRILGENQPPEAYDRMRDELGLDRPVATQYLAWLRDLLSGDMGKAYTPPRAEVVSIMKSATPVTLELALLALVIALAGAVPLAMWCSYRRGGITDRLVTGVCMAVVALPHFVIAFLLILAFTMLLPLAPRLGWVAITENPVDNLKHAMLPATALAIPMLALFQQVLRDDLVSALRQDYVLTAKAAGLGPLRILVFWTLRPSLLSLVTVVGVSIGYVIGATAIVEVMFGLPGLGLLLVNAITEGDVPVAQAVVLAVTAAFVLVNTTIDILYGYLDPRIRRATR